MTLTAYARNLARLLAPYRGTAALIAVLLGVDVAFSAAWPLSFKVLIDRMTRADKDELKSQLDEMQARTKAALKAKK